MRDAPPGDKSTCHKISVKQHQVVAVAAKIAEGYCLPDDDQPAYFGTILSDEMGLGKTWIAFMLITALRALRSTANNPELFERPRIMNGYKAEFLIGDHLDPS